MLFSQRGDYELTKPEIQEEFFRSFVHENFDLYLIDYRLAEKKWPVLHRRINQIGREKPFIFFNESAGDGAQLRVILLAYNYCRHLHPESINNLQVIRSLLEKRRQQANTGKENLSPEMLTSPIFFTFL